jgi:predicted ATPase
VWLGWGQCIEQYGAGEAYRPILEALGRLCRGPDGKRLIGLLEKHAPTWLVQMPALLSDAKLRALQSKVQGATKDRMLREMAEAVEALTAEHLLVLVLEDLHWSDYSTLELLSALARRREAARLLVLGTYRPIDVIVAEHPLKRVKQELQAHGQCEELALGYLSETDIEAYLANRFPVGATGRSPLQSLAQLLHQRTDGTPLFMVAVAEYFVTQGVLVQEDDQWVLTRSLEEIAVSVPDTLRQLIDTQIDSLTPDDQHLLEVASVAGTEFTAAAVAAGRESTSIEVEQHCEHLLRRASLLHATGVVEWPDGTLVARYSFQHALYQNVLYDRLTETRRIRLHRQIGERQEAAYGDRASEIAAELAVHFEQGHDYRRAIRYLGQTAENAVRKSAHQEAVTLLLRALQMLDTCPDVPERAQQELTLQLALGRSLILVKGNAAPEAAQAYERALELCQQLGEDPRIFFSLAGLFGLASNRAELQTAQDLADRLLTLAQKAQDPYLFLIAHISRGNAALLRGDLLLAQEHLQQGLSVYDSQKHNPFICPSVHDPGVVGLSYISVALALCGYLNQAQKKSEAALTLARQLGHLPSLLFALVWTTYVYQHLRQSDTALEQAESLTKLSTEQGFPLRVAQGTLLRGQALIEQGYFEQGIAQMHQGLKAAQTRGTESGQTYYLALQAEAWRRVEQIEEAASLIARALDFVGKTDEHVYGAELYRLKGELTLQQQFKVPNSEFKVPSPQHPTPRTQAEAEGYFLKAIDIARRQQAKSLELRAVMSLVRLRQQQAMQSASRNTHHETRGKLAEAHQMLSELYSWFTEGFDTKDLQEAKALLDTLRES